MGESSDAFFFVNLHQGFSRCGPTSRYMDISPEGPGPAKVKINIFFIKSRPFI